MVRKGRECTEVSDYEQESTFSLADIWHGCLRRRWAILGSVAVVTVAGAAVIDLLPDKYVSVATIAASQPLVSERYVSADNEEPVAEVVNTMKRDILSRSRLFSLVSETDLSEPGEREDAASQVERLQKDVIIEPLDPSRYDGSFSAFTIAYTSADPQLAQRVTGLITSLFLEEEERQTETKAESTSSFLTSQISDLKGKLQEQESRMQSYRRRNAGALAEQTSVNATTLASLRMQMQSVTGALTRAHQTQLSLEGSLRDYVSRLENERAGLLKNLTERHPSVVKRDEEIARVHSLIARGGIGASGFAGNSDDAVLSPILRQLEATTNEISSLKSEERSLSQEIARYQGLVNQAPLHEQEWDVLQRDYDLYKRNYDDLVNKQLASKMTTTLQEKQQGRRFRVVDPPSLPLKPNSPNRLRLGVAALAAGLFIGFALAFLLELRDRSFHSERQVSDRFPAPIVVSVPVLLTGPETRRRTMQRVMEWAGAAGVVAIIAAAELYVIRSGGKL